MLARQRFFRASRLVFLLLLASCGQSPRKWKALSPAKGESRDEQSRVLVDEARLLDVPVPLGAQIFDVPDAEALTGFVEGAAQEITLAAHFKTDISLQELLRFYRGDMERLGWQASMEVLGGQQATLVYRSPDKRALITIRSERSQRLVTIIRLRLTT